jgi:predicted metal-dependent phosphoesterase TrpH
MVTHLAPEAEPLWVAAQDAVALRRVFEAITAESCPRFYNFHMHTVCSDGRLQPEQLIMQAQMNGLQGLSITDHHSTKGYRRAQQWLDNQHRTDPTCPLPHLWTGMEINAELLGDEVHILAYAFDPDHAAIAPYQQQEAVTGERGRAAQVIAAIHSAGGLAVLAHPARYRRSTTDLIHAAAAAGIDGVEAYYAYNNPNPWQPSPRQTQEVCSLSAIHSLLKTCGTDTHGMSILQRL